ncbi:hypothetical protein [Paeniglutamicibacter sp. NPDC091659]|uniref:hypothetical protein n=1 Tax=Paeniglutamicibacter sp. NPDC091659 TaxID=3364389 RepID=UPI00381CBAB4
MSRKAKPLIRARNKPNFGLPWLSILLGAATLVLGTTGIAVVTAQPTNELTIVIEGQQPWNISQETVEAALDGPVAAWKPFTLRVIDRPLTAEEQQGSLAPGTDVLLSTALPDPIKPSHDAAVPKKPFDKAAIRPLETDPAENLDIGRGIHDAYQSNVGIGHGPLAVVAAAQEASLLLYDGPTRSPWPWIAGTLLGLALTVYSLSKALRRRALGEARFRRLTAAQRQLASVVLELEALEVTYLAIDPDRRPQGFTASWTKVRKASLELARTEKRVTAAVYARRSALTPETAKKLERFESLASRLTASADAVMGAGAVIGGFGGGETTFQRLAAPLTFATRELLARLRAAPAGAVEPKMIADLESALAALLAASTGETGRTDHAVQVWDRAERLLKRHAHAISRKLRRMLPRRPEVAPRPSEDLTVLRTSLGLSPRGSLQSLNAVDVANAMAREAFGALPEFDVEQEPALRAAPARPTLQPRLKPRLRRIVTGGLKVLGGIALVVGSFLLTAATSAQIYPWHNTNLLGTQQLHSLRFEPDSSKFDEDEIRRTLEDKFTETVDMTVVARDAEDDLLLTQDSDERSKLYDAGGTDAIYRFDPEPLVKAMWEIKREHPELVDPRTGELLPGQAMVPVWFFDNGRTIVPVRMVSAVYVGEPTGLNRFDWENNKYWIDGSPEGSVVNGIEGIARGLQTNNYRDTDSSEAALSLLLFPTFGLLLFLGYQVLRYGGTMSMRLGRFGRGAARLRTVRGNLETLTLGLDDSRLNSVLMFDQGSAPTAADADQRLFESALAVAWRMSDELASRPLSQRLGPDYLEQIRRLEYLVSVLSVRDADVAGRAQRLLDAMHGVG